MTALILIPQDIKELKSHLLASSILFSIPNIALAWLVKLLQSTTQLILSLGAPCAYLPLPQLFPPMKSYLTALSTTSKRRSPSSCSSSDSRSPCSSTWCTRSGTCKPYMIPRSRSLSPLLVFFREILPCYPSKAPSCFTFYPRFLLFIDDTLAISHVNRVGLSEQHGKPYSISPRYSQSARVSK